MVDEVISRNAVLKELQPISDRCPDSLYGDGIRTAIRTIKKMESTASCDKVVINLSEEDSQKLLKTLRATSHVLKCVDDVEADVEFIHKGTWIAVRRGAYVDIACSHCKEVRFNEYGYNCSVEQVLNHIKTIDTKLLPKFCEHCGARMEGIKGED